MLPHQARQQLALDAFAGQSISALADQHQVSRKFVYRQLGHAHDAFDQAFAPPADQPPHLLFRLPVTKPWLRQLVLGLTLICHSPSAASTNCSPTSSIAPRRSARSTTSCNRPSPPRRPHNTQPDLAAIRIGAHDEIFQAGRPVLVGADVVSTYCYLLSPEEHRDADAWGVRLLELCDRGFRPDAAIADFAGGFRAGQAEALPDAPCRGDVFHALQTAMPLVGYLENHAYDAIDTRSRLENRRARTTAAKAAKRRRRRVGSATPARPRRRPWPSPTRRPRSSAGRVGTSGPCAVPITPAAALYTTGSSLNCGYASAPPPADSARPLPAGKPTGQPVGVRQATRPGPGGLGRRIPGARVAVAETRHVPSLAAGRPERWQREQVLWRRWGSRYGVLREAVAELLGQVVRASSVIENPNSRLRNYFFRRRHLGADYRALLQFFLNHRRFVRSEHAERVGKSPADC